MNIQVIVQDSLHSVPIKKLSIFPDAQNQLLMGHYSSSLGCYPPEDKFWTLRLVLLKLCILRCLPITQLPVNINYTNLLLVLLKAHDIITLKVISIPYIEKSEKTNSVITCKNLIKTFKLYFKIFIVGYINVYHDL